MKNSSPETIIINPKDISLLSKYLLTLYQSDIQLDLMYNSICRLFSKCLRASSASLLLYDGFTNSLRVSGIYLNLRQSKKSIKTVGEDFEQIFSNILLFEYVRYLCKDEAYLGEKLAFSDFITYCNKRNIVFHDVTLETFNKFSESIKRLWPSYKIYLDLIKKDDIYAISEIEDQCDPALIYVNLVNLSRDANISYEEAIIFDKKNCQGTMSTAELLIKKNILHKFDYEKIINFPLVFRGRVFGLLRLTFDKFLVQGLWSSTGTIKAPYKNSLEAALMSISFFIGRQYPQNALLKLDLHRVVDSANLDDVCEGFRQMVNCYGCIIRILRESDKKYIIKGKTKNVANYINDHIHKSDCFSNNKKLEEIFSRQSNKNNHITILGLKFSIVKSSQENSLGLEDITFYYRTDEELIRSTNDIYKLKKKKNIQFDIQNILTSEYFEICYKHNIHEVIILPIFDNDYQMGYLSIANTQYRYFFENDISVIYPFVQRLGLEYLASKSNIKDFQVLFLDHINHEFSSSVIETLTMLNDSDINLNEQIEIAKGKLLGIKYLGEEINNFNAIKYKENLVLSQNEYLINTVLAERGKKFLEVINGMEKSKNSTKRGKIRKIQYEILSELPDNYKTTYNQSLLTLPILHLLTNARKYSFDSKFHPRAKNKHVNSDYAKRLLIIQKTCLQETKLCISVSNYGLPLPKDRDSIFEAGIRTPRAKKIASGDGNGLAIAKQFISWLGGEIVSNHSKYLTTFTIKLPIWPLKNQIRKVE